MALARSYRFVWNHEKQASNATLAAVLREQFLGLERLETLEALQERAEALIGGDAATVAEPLARRHTSPPPAARAGARRTHSRRRAALRARTVSPARAEPPTVCR